MPMGQLRPLNKRHFTIISKGTQEVSVSSAAPSSLPVLEKLDGSAQFEVDVATNAVRNVGDDVPELIGTLSFQPTVAAAAARTLTLWAEMSMDGITWAPITDTLRTIDIRGDLESFVTIASRGDVFPAGAWVRWQMYADNSITLTPPAVITVGTGSVGGYSVLWELTEV